MIISKNNILNITRVLVICVTVFFIVACDDGSLKTNGMLTSVSSSRIAVYEIRNLDGSGRTVASQVGLSHNQKTEFCINGKSNKKWSDLKLGAQVRVIYDTSYTALYVEQNC